MTFKRYYNAFLSILQAGFKKLRNFLCRQNADKKLQKQYLAKQKRTTAEKEYYVDSMRYMEKYGITVKYNRK